MEHYEASVNLQYGQSDLGEALLTTLAQAGKDVEALTADDLAPFEEIHIRGREATRELALAVPLWEGAQALDVGCGIGGPARLLAAEFGCRVTGLDLTESFIRAAEMLTARLGLSDRVRFRQGSALEMPFDAETFDVAWMQHINMNIPDKDRLFREIHRVLRPGGRFAFYEILAGPVAPPHYPVPWANDPALSFLVTSEEFRTALLSAGFQERAWSDDTERCLQWHRARIEARRAGAPLPIGVDLILGANYPEKSRNVLRNLEENRIAVIQALFSRE